MQLRGTYTALITPFRQSSSNPRGTEIDYEQIESIIDWQIASGITGIVLCGTTAESVTLSAEEKLELVKFSVRHIGGRVPVIVGTGTNDTYASTEATKQMAGLGVDAALCVVPYYNRPTQDGIYEHFAHIANHGGLPIVMYNVPARTCADMLPSTVSRLASHPNIIGIKEASGLVERMLEIGSLANSNFALVTGEDAITCYCMFSGGVGTISASANVIPREICAIVNAGLNKDHNACIEAQLRARNIIKALFIEPNPIPAKAALKLLGHLSDDCLRLPLVPASIQTRTVLKELLSELGYAI